VSSSSFGDDEEDQCTPTDKIVLRVLKAIEDKNSQWKAWVNKGRISEKLPYVIAINTGEIVSAITNESPPLSAYTCLGFGGYVITFDNQGRGKASILPNPTIQRECGKVEDTMIFRKPEHSHLSGILLSGVNPFFRPRERGGFEFLHNTIANTEKRIPLGWFRQGKEYWVEDETLDCRSYDST